MSSVQSLSQTVITSCTMLSCDAMSNMMFSRSPRRRRSRSSSRSRRCRPEHSRSRESRWRSRSRDRSERENNRERRQKGLPIIKSQTLSGMCQESEFKFVTVSSSYVCKRKRIILHTCFFFFLFVLFFLSYSLQYYTLDWTAGQENPTVWCGVPFRGIWSNWVNQCEFG